MKTIYTFAIRIEERLAMPGLPDPDKIMFETQWGELSLARLGSMGWKLASIYNNKWIFYRE